MKILKILGIAAGIHALALILLLSSPGCSSSKAAPPDNAPIRSAPDSAGPAATIQMPDSVGIRYSPTRPGTTVAAALETQPVSGVTPATTYTVAPGDTLSAVAKKNQLTKAELASANNLKSGSVLRVGQRLLIPAKGHPALASAQAPAQEAPSQAAGADKAAADGTRHLVRAGETLGGIARKYGVKQGDIAVANNITDPRRIHPGQELVIPSKSSTGAKASKASAARGQPSASAPPPTDQDLDAGLKTAPTDVPTVKIDDSPAPQPSNP